MPEITLPSTSPEFGEKVYIITVLTDEHGTTVFKMDVPDSARLKVFLGDPATDSVAQMESLRDSYLELKADSDRKLATLTEAHDSYQEAQTAAREAFTDLEKLFQAWTHRTTVAP